MKRWGIIYLAMVVALGMAATSCKKGTATADSSSYLANPNDTTVPPPKLPADPYTPSPCPGKGAMGMQTLLLKGDCTKLTPPKCGNGITETSAGEECDSGADNGTLGNNCGTDCKKVKGGGGGTPKKPGDPTTGPSIKITNKKAMTEGHLGSPYPITSIIATPTGTKKGETFVWTVTDLPDGKFSSTPTGDTLTLKISSKDPLWATGSFPIGVKVCLASDPTICDTCDVSVCSITVTDQLKMSAFDYKTPGPKKASICDDTGTTLCSPFVLNIDDYLGEGTLGYLPTAFGKPNYVTPDPNNPFYVLKLKANGVPTLVEPVYVDPKGPPAGPSTTCNDNGVGQLKGCYTLDDKTVGYLDDYTKLYYKWSMTWSTTKGGTKVTAPPIVKWMDFNSEKNSLSTDEQKGLFLMDSTDEKAMFIHPSEAIIMAGPLAMGQTFYDVVVTVTSAQGGTQTMTFPSIVLPPLKDAQKVVVDNDPCGPTKYTPVKITQMKLTPDNDFQDATSTKDSSSEFDVNTTLYQAYPEVVYKIEGGKAPYAVSELPNVTLLNGAEGNNTWTDTHKGDEAWQLVGDPKLGDTETTFAVKGGTNYSRIESFVAEGNESHFVSGYVTEGVRVSVTDACNKTAKATTYFKSEIPKPVNMSELKSIYVDFITDWTDGSSKMNVQLLGNGDSVLAETGDLSVHGPDDGKTHSTGFWTLKLTESCISISHGCKISDLKKIRIHMSDPGCCADMTYNFYEFDLIAENWYATNTDDWGYYHNHDYEVDGESKDEMYYSTDDDKDPLGKFVRPSDTKETELLNKHWQPRPHMGGQLYK